MIRVDDGVRSDVTDFSNNRAPEMPPFEIAVSGNRLLEMGILLSDYLHILAKVISISS